jgi:hypothetical protein
VFRAPNEVRIRRVAIGCSAKQLIERDDILAEAGGTCGSFLADLLSGAGRGRHGREVAIGK